MKIWTSVADETLVAYRANMAIFLSQTTELWEKELLELSLPQIIIRLQFLSFVSAVGEKLWEEQGCL